MIIRFGAKNPVPKLRNQKPMLLTWAQVRESMAYSDLPLELWPDFFEMKTFPRRSVPVDKAEHARSAPIVYAQDPDSGSRCSVSIHG